MTSERSIVAAAQLSPVVGDLAASVERARTAILEAGKHGARLIVFPEGYLPGYPFWVWFVPAGRTALLRKLYGGLVENSVDVAGKEVGLLSAAARDARVNVAVGINERNSEASNASIYNSLMMIDSSGRIVGCHRKLVPTVGERIVHARGDASTLQVYDLPDVGRVGGLICWENYMPLARYALYAQRLQVHVAPTWDRGEPWTSTLRHIAKEGRAFVIGCCSAMRRSDLGELGDELAEYLPNSEWINPGGSCIVDPDGKFLVEPVFEREEILFAEIDSSDFTGPRYQIDVAGHYSRPDLFDLRINRKRQSTQTSEMADDADDPDGS